jgi:hypothetical protein
MRFSIFQTSYQTNLKDRLFYPQAIIEENMGKRGGQRMALTMHSGILGTDKLTKLKTVKDHVNIAAKLPGAVSCHCPLHGQVTFVLQDELITISLASDKYGDKKNRAGRFVDPLDLVYRNAVEAVKEIYSQER